MCVCVVLPAWRIKIDVIVTSCIVFAASEGFLLIQMVSIGHSSRLMVFIWASGAGSGINCLKNCPKMWLLSLDSRCNGGQWSASGCGICSPEFQLVECICPEKSLLMTKFIRHVQYK